MNRCDYCRTWPGALRCDNCGAPKAPAPPAWLSGMPGSAIRYTSTPFLDAYIQARQAQIRARELEELFRYAEVEQLRVRLEYNRPLITGIS